MRTRALLEDVQRYAAFDIDVLVTGETGTGKELVARQLHEQSLRRNGPFVPVDSGAIPNELVEREFFGHEMGAFTGAQSREMGLFESASGGTLFLDEIGNLPVSVQVKLLRVLQERRIRRLGGIKDTTIDVRVIAATSVDLDRAIEEGCFRRDLYYRINVARIHLAPLRERTEDIALLARHFQTRDATRFGHQAIQLAPETVEVLEAYAWPGNVRELENVMQRALATCRGDTVHPEHLPPEVRATAGEKQPLRAGSRGGNGAHPCGTAELAPLEDIVRHHVLTVLKHVGGNRTRAAEILGVDPKTLRRKLQTYGSRGSR
jgi:DNA-binding NtrC family response regulator